MRNIVSKSGGPVADASKPHLLFVEDEATLREHLAERLSDEYNDRYGRKWD